MSKESLMADPDLGFLNAETITIFLIRMNEDPGTAALLSVYFPWLKFEQSEFTRNLKPVTRNAAVVALTSRIIGRWARSSRTAFLLDDMQWIDSMSLEVLSSLFKSKPQSTLLFLSTRPLDDMDFKAPPALANSSFILHVKLEGLRREDVKKYLESKLDDNSKVLDAALTNLLLEKSSTSPLALELAVDVLKRTKSIFSQEGVLKGGKLEEISRILDNNMSYSIMMQFNRLDSDFQEFLRRAAVLGQHIDLNDVAEMMEPPTDVYRLQRLIDIEDAFSYMRDMNEDVASDSPMSVALGLHPLGKNQRRSQFYYFRNMSVASSIYENIPGEEKRRLHKLAGMMYEARLCPEQRDTLLPLLYHHFTLSGDIARRIYYAEELGYLYDTKCFRKEACFIFLELIDFVRTVQYLPPDLADSDRIAGWHAIVASTASYDYQAKYVVESAREALRLVGMTLPPIDQVPTTAVLRELFRHIAITLKTRGGRRQTPCFKGDVDRVIMRCNIACRSLLAMMWMLYPKDEVPTSFKLLCMLQLLNVTLVSSPFDPSQLANSGFSFSYLLLLKSPMLAKLYWRIGRAAAARCRPEQLSPAFPAFGAIVSSLDKETVMEMEEASELFQEVFLQENDLAQWRVARNLLFYVRHPRSSEEAKDLLMDRIDEIMECDTNAALFTIALACRCAIIFKDMDFFDLCYDYYLRIQTSFVEKYGSEPEQLSIPAVIFDLWKRIFARDHSGALQLIPKVSALFAKQKSGQINYFNGVARFGFMAFWPLLTHLDRLGNTDPATARRGAAVLADAVEAVRVILDHFARHVFGDDHSARLVYAAQAIAKGKKPLARRLLRAVLRPHVVRFWHQREPLWFGIANAAMWLLEGEQAFKDAAVLWFERYGAVAFLEWVREAEPYGFLCARSAGGKAKGRSAVHPGEK
ncbi:hypothetical protein HDU96_001601 [Phlyctochytrium bullatum]|nr:hypothetical protein HDU96_001601 [Phlyctochytrium bullatum]